MISILNSTTYLCEQTLSKMKYVIFKYRINLIDGHLRATIGFDPNNHGIVKDKQFQTFH